MPSVRLPNNWNPREYQVEPWVYLQEGGKRLVAVCHRRWGKDDVALHSTAIKAMEKPATYWHMLPKATQARKAIWQAINPHTGKKRIDEAFPQEIRKRTNDNEMFIEFVNGSMWHVVGSDNYDNLVGAPPAGIVFSEWSLCDPASWAFLEPILIENGGWAVFIYTSRGKNHGYTLLNLAKKKEDWMAYIQTAAETSVFTPQQLEDALDSLVAIWGEEQGNLLFQQEYFCSFDGGGLGAVYASDISDAESEGRVCHVPIEKSVEVNTYWDLGMNDTTAIWFYQRVGLEDRFIDYYEINGKGLDHYAKVLKEKGYNYGIHAWPHDGGHRQLADPQGRTMNKVMESLGIQPIKVLPKPREILSGIEACRNMIKRAYFDEVRCKRGLSALMHYHREYDEKRGAFKDKPVHDWSSNGSDAFRTAAMYAKGKAKVVPFQIVEREVAFGAW